MFENLLKGIKIIVFDIDDTLLLWNHSKRWDDSYSTCKKSFIDDDKWDSLNREQDVYSDIESNLVIRDILLSTVNRINEDVYKAKRHNLTGIMNSQMRVFALSADTSRYAMINKTRKLMEEYPDNFYGENILSCNTPEQKIKVLDEICAIYDYNPDEILFIDDLQSTLMAADNKGYRVETPQNIMNEWVKRTGLLM